MQSAHTPDYANFMIRAANVNPNKSASAFHYAWYMTMQGALVPSQSVVRFWFEAGAKAMAEGLFTADTWDFMQDMFPVYVTTIWGETDFAFEVCETFYNWPTL